MRRSQEASLETLFYNESRRRLQSVLEGLQSYKASGLGLDRIKTALHTLKGSSNMMGLTDLASEFHHLEELFHTVLSPEDPKLPEAERALFAVAEKLQAPTKQAEHGGADSLLPAESALPVFQRLLGSVARLELLMEGAKTNSEQVIAGEVWRLRELAFRSIFTPTGHLFSGLRELSEVVGKPEKKKVQLTCRTATDNILRDYLVELRGALVHLVNNCVVHGVESPSEREERGKSPTGLIEIDIFQEDEYLCLEIQDDGRGVDLLRLQEIYERETGRADWESLGAEAQRNLLFEEGRSLKDSADLHSGRGMGLSAVKESVHRLQGKVFFKDSNVGACLRIEIPSPFFLSRCLLVRSRGRMFGVLAGSVQRVSISEKERKDTPFPDVAGCFGYPDAADSGEQSYILWPPVEDLTERVPLEGFVVSECLGLQDLLVYALPKLDGLSPSAVGTAESAGEQLFVIDLKELPSDARSRGRRRIAPTPVTRKKILVVDDSVTTRSILVDVLHRAGYHVEEATDGLEGRVALETKPFDLVVSDLEMPNCDGLELLKWIRSEESRVPGIPFLLFTSRDDIKSFETAHLLGADRCLSKGHFREGNFLRLLEQLL